MNKKYLLLNQFHLCQTVYAFGFWNVNTISRQTIIFNILQKCLCCYIYRIIDVSLTYDVLIWWLWPRYFVCWGVGLACWASCQHAEVSSPSSVHATFSNLCAKWPLMQFGSVFNASRIYKHSNRYTLYFNILLNACVDPFTVNSPDLCIWSHKCTALSMRQLYQIHHLSKVVP